MVKSIVASLTLLAVASPPYPLLSTPPAEADSPSGASQVAQPEGNALTVREQLRGYKVGTKVTINLSNHKSAGATVSRRNQC